MTTLLLADIAKGRLADATAKYLIFRITWKALPFEKVQLEFERFEPGTHDRVAAGAGGSPSP